MPTAVIIDDEPNCRQMLQGMLAEFFADIEIVATGENVEDGIKIITQYKPDLVFLDIQLHDRLGFDILRSIGDIRFKLIIVTAHNEYAIQAVKFSAIDYIMKPIDAMEFFKGVKNAIAQLNIERQSVQFDALWSNMSHLAGSDKKVVLKTAESIYLLKLNQIIRCESDNNYTTFYTTDNERILVSRPIKEYEEMFADYNFFRVHQRHLVNLNFVKKFDKRDGGFLIMSDKESVPVASRKRQKLISIFEAM